MIVTAIIKATEHKTTRKPCEAFKAQVYHLGEYTGRAMDELAKVVTKENVDELIPYGLQQHAVREGAVYFEQMQCMQRVVLKYVKLPGPLLGVGTDAAKLTCQGGETDLDKDEDKATEAIEKMITQWTQWEQSSGIRDAMRAKEKAKRDKSGPLADIKPILEGVNKIENNVNKIVSTLVHKHLLDKLLADDPLLGSTEETSRSLSASRSTTNLHLPSTTVQHHPLE